MIELSKDKFKIVGYEYSASEAMVRPNISYWQDAWRRLKKNKVAILSLYVLGTIALMCIIGPYISKYKFDVQDYKLLDKAPYGDHWFGTDNLGRDLFVRTWKGGRVSFIIGFVGTFLEIIIGVTYGGICGYFGGRVDLIMMRIIEILAGIPFLLVVILLLLVLPPGITAIILALCITGWLGLARLIRGQVMQLKSSEYVLAAQALGASPTRVIARHLVPNAIGIIIVYMSLDVPAFIFEEAFLSFLGLGVKPPETSWGALIFDAQGIMSLHPHELLFPAVLLCLTVLAFNLLGDGLRDALDPRLRQ